MKENTILKTHRFAVNKDDGGEGLSITTKFISNGDDITDTDGVFLNQVVQLNSFCNSASLNLFGTTFTPSELRRLANELEQVRNSIK